MSMEQNTILDLRWCEYLKLSIAMI